MLRKGKTAPGWHPAAAQTSTARSKNYSACASCRAPGPILCHKCSSWAATAFYLTLARSALAGTT